MRSEMSVHVYMVVGVIVLAVLSVVLGGCCSPQATRCSGNVLQVCDGTRRWIPHTNCSDGEPGRWVCSVEEDEHICVQEEGEL